LAVGDVAVVVGDVVRWVVLGGGGVGMVIAMILVGAVDYIVDVVVGDVGAGKDVGGYDIIVGDDVG